MYTEKLSASQRAGGRSFLSRGAFVVYAAPIVHLLDESEETGRLLDPVELNAKRLHLDEQVLKSRKFGSFVECR